MNLSFPKRRWYQFSLRSIFVAVTFLCVGPLGYVAWERERCRRGTEAVAMIEGLGDTKLSEKRLTFDDQARRNGWIRKLLGADDFRHVTWVHLGGQDVEDKHVAGLAYMPNIEGLDLYNSQVTDQGISHLSDLPKLRILSLGQTQVTDEGLRTVAKLKNLVSLEISNTRITNSGLKMLAGLAERLHWLNLGVTGVTDEGLSHLQALNNLQVLDLYGTRVTDAGLVHLHNLKSLGSVNVVDTPVTYYGVGKLKEELPKLKNVRF